MKKQRRLLPITLLLVLGMLVVGVSAAEVGSAEDPLVSLSYLQETFLNQIMANVDALLIQRNQEVTAEVDGMLESVREEWPEESAGTTNRTFAVVTLNKGQTLTGAIGCEVMLRVGTAVCVSSSSPGLIDQTDGAVLNNGGELVKNHLYMMTIEERGITATATSVKVLVRGTYTVSG